MCNLQAPWFLADAVRGARAGTRIACNGPHMPSDLLLDVSSSTVLPLRTVGTRYTATGEQRLLLAVLCDAMQAYAVERRGKRRPGRLRELRQWFESGDRSYVFSFESVCDLLGLDTWCVRHHVFAERISLLRPWGHRVHPHRVVAPRAPRGHRAAIA